MSETNATAEEAEVKSDAPPPAEGQADGSPPPEDQRPNEGQDEGAEAEPQKEDPQVLELRRKLSEIGEDRKEAITYLQRILGDPKLGPQARAVLDGKPAGTEEEASEEEELLKGLTADEIGAKNLKRLLDLQAVRLKREFGASVKPLARTVMSGREAQALADALEGAGLDSKMARSAEFKAFVRDYEAENDSWYPGAKARAPEAMAELLVKEFAAKRPRETRDTRAAKDASLQRGGGNGARTAAAENEMEFDPRAADAFAQIKAIVRKGGKPVPKRA